MLIKRALQQDAEALTQVAFAAKMVWGYPESWIQKWRGLLTVTPDYIAAHPVFAATLGEKIVGFYGLGLDRDRASVDHFWVVPTSMRQGIGSSLFRHCEETAKAAGASRLEIESDPHAAGFYQSMGASIIGQIPAKMDDRDRFLPILEKNLA
jgi:GNAT superfamily N-acetyltransferase